MAKFKYNEQEQLDVLNPSQEKEHMEMKFAVIKTENGKAGFSTEKC